MDIQWPDLAAAVALLLVIEGLLPFLSPQRFRRAMNALSAVSDGQLRGVGLASMLAGLLLLWLVRS